MLLEAEVRKARHKSWECIAFSQHPAGQSSQCGDSVQSFGADLLWLR